MIICFNVFRRFYIYINPIKWRGDQGLEPSAIISVCYSMHNFFLFRTGFHQLVLTSCYILFYSILFYSTLLCAAHSVLVTTNIAIWTSSYFNNHGDNWAMAEVERTGPPGKKNRTLLRREPRPGMFPADFWGWNHREKTISITSWWI